MGIVYKEEDVGTGGERWLILNDRKSDDPEKVKFLDAEMRKKKDGSGEIPVLLFMDSDGTKYVCSGFPRQIEKLAQEWGINTDNWIGQTVHLKPKGRGMELIPIVKTVEEVK